MPSVPSVPLYNLYNLYNLQTRPVFGSCACVYPTHVVRPVVIHAIHDAVHEATDKMHHAVDDASRAAHEVFCETASKARHWIDDHTHEYTTTVEGKANEDGSVAAEPEPLDDPLDDGVASTAVALVEGPLSGDESCLTTDVSV